MLPVFARVTPAGLELRLKVVPGASQNALAGVLGERLKVRIAAAPEGGKANRAVCALVGRWLGRPDVQVLAGATSPVKVLLVPGLSVISAQQLAEIV